MTETAITPSGCFLLVPCRVDVAQDDGWTDGPVPFRLTGKAKEAIGTHLRHPSPDGILGADERRDSWRPSTQAVLFPDVKARARKGPTTRRRHRVIGKAAARGLTVAGVEYLVVTDLGTRTPPAVLIVHLAVDDSLDHRSVLEKLYGDVRVARGREALLHDLQAIVGDGVTLTGRTVAAEGSTVVYPVTTALNLEMSKDEDVLVARQLATLTPSKTHGTVGGKAEAERLARARAGLRPLSDEWSVMVTGHGTVFVSSAEGRFAAARTYVSSLYSDAMAAEFLHYTILQELGVEAADLVRQGATLTDHHDHALDRVSSLRYALLWAGSVLGHIPSNESRINKLLMGELATNLNLGFLEQNLSEDVAALMEILSLANDRAVIRRDRRLNMMLAILTLVGLPLTIFYAALDSERISPTLFWPVTSAFLLVAAVGLIIYSIRSRSSLGDPSEPSGGER